MTDLDERLREALRAAGARPESSGDPIDPEVIWEAAHGRGDPEARAALASRLAEEPALLEEWRLVASFAEAADRDEAETGVEVPIRAKARTPAPPEAAANAGNYGRWLVVAAVVAAAVLLVILLPRGDSVRYEDDARQLRDAQSGRVESRTEGSLSRDAAVLSWSAIEGASAYEVYVTTGALEPVFEARALSEPTVTIDAARLAELPSGTRLLWRVETVMPDGSRRRSETFDVSLE